MSPSDRCIALIKRFEGFSATPYLCPAGVWTIGYGTTSIHGKPVTENTPQIDSLVAEIYLRADIRRFADAVNMLVTVPITQSSFDALVSFAYNVGEIALASSTLLRKLNAGDYIGADKEFDRWVFAGGKRLKGLERRRDAEQALFDEFSPDDIDVPAIQKPLSKSRTVKATAAATAGTLTVTAAAEVIQQASPVFPVLTKLAQHAPWVICLIVLITGGVILYARLDDRNKGLR